MITSEIAGERLKRFKIEEWQERRIEAIKNLPAEQREIGELLLPRKFSYSDCLSFDQEKHSRQQEKAMETLYHLSSNERKSVIAAFLPKMADIVEIMLQKARTAPYQMSWSQRPFRAPNSPKIDMSTWMYLLSSLISAMEGYEEDVAWLAAWIPHMMVPEEMLAPLFAAAIDSGTEEGDRVFSTLLESGRGEHEIGIMGRHIISSLLQASRPEGWEFVEKLLCAAQRQEGLRQTIIEALAMAHPDAFIRMLRQIIDLDLARFSSVVMELNELLGLQWQAADYRKLVPLLTMLLQFIEKPEKRADAVDNGDGRSAYLALWASAFFDAPDTLHRCIALLRDRNAERRCAALLILIMTGLEDAAEGLIAALDDDDLRIANIAVHQYLQGTGISHRVFDALEKNHDRFPEEETTPEPLLWEWCRYTQSREKLMMALVNSLGTRSPRVLIPRLSSMKSGSRWHFVSKLSFMEHFSAQDRKIFVKLAGDAASNVRALAFTALEKMTVEEDDALILEGYLKRKASDLRKGVITVLLKQEDRSALESGRRLSSSSDTMQRKAGLEIMELMKQRRPEEAQDFAQSLKADRAGMEEEERTLVRRITGEDNAVPTLDDALGLADPALRTKPLIPEDRRPFLDFKAAVGCLTALDELVHRHQEEVVEIEPALPHQEARREMLGALQWGFPQPTPGIPADDDSTRLPLAELWEGWWASRTPDLIDHDGCELLRSMLLFCRGVAIHEQTPDWAQKTADRLYGGFSLEKMKYPHLLVPLVEWLIKVHPPQEGVEYVLNVLETMLSLVPHEVIISKPAWGLLGEMDWRTAFSLQRGLSMAAHFLLHHHPSLWDRDMLERLWRLLRWIDEPIIDDKGMARLRAQKEEGSTNPVIKNIPAFIKRMMPEEDAPPSRFRTDLDTMLILRDRGIASDADLYDLLLGPRTTVGWASHFHEIRQLSRRGSIKECLRYPWLAAIIEKCRERILCVVAGRGEIPSPACAAARDLRHTGNLGTFITFLKALGTGTFTRGWTYDGTSRSSVFSHIIRSSFPSDGDSPHIFAAEIRKAGIGEARLIEAALFAPQWSTLIEGVLGWKGFSSAVWWVHAHTKDVSWTVDPEIRESWNAEVNTFTPLSGTDLLDGAVDVEWFNQAYEALGEKRWEAIEKAIRYASTGSGHTRAKLFADAMRGKVEGEEIKARIREKRHQDSVRALGLIPLPETEKDAQLLDRYLLLQEFTRTGAHFGAQKRESEKRAVRIAMENLARTSGYPDPIRLEWAMEAYSVRDIADGPLSIEVEDISITLAIDQEGTPELAACRAGTPLSSIPVQIRKNPGVAALRKRFTGLKQQIRRMRSSLEESMCRGDRYSPGDLANFAKHPLLAPLVSRLIFTCDGISGHPAPDGTTLRGWDGRVHRLSSGDSLQIAHPCDLFRDGSLARWQAECFKEGIVQPFKQVFRELYLFFPGERGEGELSCRYAGHQVQPRRAAALMGARGWVNHPEEGIRRTFHEEHIRASLITREGYFTPAEIEGLTIEGIIFSSTTEWTPVALDMVSPRVFSEVMRDMDLVVSVAHQGGVDPEASMSTVEMRAALARETCSLMNLSNVRIKDTWVMVDGKIGHYRVHLGSAVIHRIPGGHVCIVPVHSQHRGRLFLPFMDDDPRSAEVISKVLLLAEDEKIMDPSILEQIR